MRLGFGQNSGKFYDTISRLKSYTTPPVLVTQDDYIRWLHNTPFSYLVTAYTQTYEHMHLVYVDRDSNHLSVKIAM